MNPVWRFLSETWDEDGLCTEHTIADEAFGKLMDLCFAQADVFSFGAALWTHATDRGLEKALRPFQIGRLRTDRWFCYASTAPALEIRLYRAEPGAREAIQRHIRQLFLWDDDESFCSLEDLCFFRKDQLFFGTVTHERICYAHILTEEFGAALKALGGWEDGSDNDLVSLNLKNFQILSSDLCSPV